MAQVLDAPLPQHQAFRLGVRPQIWKCGNLSCNNLVSDVDRKSKFKKYCSSMCRDFVNQKKHRERANNAYQRKLKVKQWKRNHYLNHREEILRKAKEKYHRTKGNRRPYVRTPENVKSKLIYYLKHREQRLAYQRDYYQRKKQGENP